MEVDDRWRIRLSRIRLLVCDVDGTLTDGAMWYGPEGEALKRFHTRDGHGIGLLRSVGITVALVTSERSRIVTARATKLDVTEVVLGATEKGSVVRELQGRLGVSEIETASIGDDLGDLAAFAMSGVRVAVADAVAEVRAAADLICDRAGGQGAVRELADAILHGRA